MAAAHGRVLARDVPARSPCPVSTTRPWTATPPGGPRSPAPRGRRPTARRRGHPGRAHRRRPARAGHGAPDHDRRAPAAGADVVVPVELTDGGTDVVEIRDAPRARHHLARPVRTSPLARSPCRPGRRSAPRRSGWPPPSASRPCRCGAVPACWCCPPAASWSSRRPLRPGQIYESNSRCWPPPWRTRAARRAGCTSSRTTSTSSSRRCGPRWRRRTC